LPVARQHELLDAAGAATEARLVDAVERNAHLAALQDLRDVAALRRVAHRLSHQRLGAAQEALAVLQALAARVETPVDDMHCLLAIRRLSRPASPACTTRPGGGPGARYSRAPSCAGRTPRASSRSRRPASTRTRSPEADPRPARTCASRSPR